MGFADRNQGYVRRLAPTFLSGVRDLGLNAGNVFNYVVAHVETLWIDRGLRNNQYGTLPWQTYQTCGGGSISHVRCRHNFPVCRASF